MTPPSSSLGSVDDTELLGLQKTLEHTNLWGNAKSSPALAHGVFYAWNRGHPEGPRLPLQMITESKKVCEVRRPLALFSLLVSPLESSPCRQKSKDSLQMAVVNSGMCKRKDLSEISPVDRRTVEL